MNKTREQQHQESVIKKFFNATEVEIVYDSKGSTLVVMIKLSYSNWEHWNVVFRFNSKEEMEDKVRVLEMCNDKHT